MLHKVLLAAIGTAVIAVVLHGLAQAAEQPGPLLAIFDTATTSPAPLSGQALTSKAGWTRLAEEETSRAFKGDAVLANDRLLLVFRQQSPGVELYAIGSEKPVLRAVLAPTTEKAPARLASVTVAENTATEVALDAVFEASDGKPLGVRFELQPGQVFAKTDARGGTKALRLESPCRFAILPDFFADDIAIDASELTTDRVELPSENFLLHMLGRDEAIVLAVWNYREEDIQVTLSGRGKSRAIQASEIPYGKKGSVFVAALECPGIWHWHDVSKADAGRVVGMDWKSPFPAHWRMDWRQDDGLTDCWDMLLEQSGGTYVKPDWFGQSEAHGTPDWMKPGRQRWTTVLGSFAYPCWLDSAGRGFLQPLKKPGKFQGPAIVYPINRVAATPLSAFTLVDLVRATLGVGPCEYVLDVEGQKKKAEGVPTCATRTKLNQIYADKQQKQRRAEVEKALADVDAFVRHIRGRIENYVDFSHEMLAYLDQQRKAQPELADFLAKMESITRRIDVSYESKKNAIQPPAYSAGLVAEFRNGLLDNDSDEAIVRCKKITAALVAVGGNQDELVGECRLAVRILRQQATLAMAVDPRTATIAKEIRRRTQAILRSPTSYEAPRH